MRFDKVLLQEYKNAWLTATIGIILSIVGSAVLYLNEGRAYKVNIALTEALKETISIIPDYYQRDVSAKSVNYEGKLIHVVNLLSVGEPLTDHVYNIQVQAVKLKKIVEMYQWHEDSTENKLITADEQSTRNYFYFKEWSGKPIDSRSFYLPGHTNPKTFPAQTQTLVAEHAFLGNFELSEDVKDLIKTFIDITSDTRPDDSYIKMHSGIYYHTDDLFDLKVGDIRIKFQFAGLEGDYYTIVGRLQQGKIVPFVSRLNKKVLLLAKGELTMEEIFKQEHHSVRLKTWTVRGFGFLMIFVAVTCTANLLQHIFARSRYFSYLSHDPNHPLSSKLRITLIIAAFVCVTRQSLHYLNILS
ncbi:unnamed protein product [Diamesa hyperborea]